ncbi:MAG: ATP-dependent DNA helicase RecG [Clostridia bacterium]|nr:ATP-dependent DNA helicase RecG [Clostridia bacterium]
MASLYEIPIEQINGIGTKRGQLYRKLGIDTAGALVRFYPRAYEDWSNITSIENAQSGETVCIKASLSSPVRQAVVSGGRILATVIVTDGYSEMKIAFFNNRYISSMLRTGSEYLFYGKFTLNYNTPEMINPTFALTGASESVPIHPIYSQVAGLSTKHIEKSVRSVLDMLPETVKDPIPENIRKRYSLPPLKSVLWDIHFPKSMDEAENAKRRLIFEELLVLVLGLSSIKTLSLERSDVIIENDHTDEFLGYLPFTLTNAQKRAIDDCISDMKHNDKAMNRLVQGDVGSGKTMVAGGAAYTCIKNGYQAAMMVPTEILAQQHYQTFSEIFENTDVKVRLLTGSMTAKQKRTILSELAEGEIDFIVGTHSLISETVVFNNLGLVITDEQHRFGVRQRSQLLSKGKNPHLLVMSATPIPRTLALIIYGDLDISIVNEMPPGRQKVDTFLIDDSVRERAYGFLKKQIEEGRQCYIVCPAVENSDTGLTGVEEYTEKIRAGALKSCRVECLHGKMKASVKDEIMNKFVTGEIDVLVSTTVIEVGVSVSNAVIMMIENAERFGLSQLHQLRGRVGRGKHKSYCILVSNAKSEEARKRLNALCQTNDGFKIADEDLKLRGPGDFFGSRQHGLPELKIADLAENIEVMHEAQEASKEIMNDYLNPDCSELRSLRAEVSMLFNNVGQKLN